MEPAKFKVEKALVIDLYPVEHIDPVDGEEVHRGITELLECSKVSPLDLQRISKFLSPDDDDPDVQRAALQLLGHAAEWENENFAKFMSVTFDSVAHLLSSLDFRVQWGALDVLKMFFWSGYHDEGVTSVVPSVLLHLQSPETDVQLASVELLDAAARSTTTELVRVVVPTLPTLVQLLSSKCIDVRDAALGVLIVSARTSTGSNIEELAEAVAATLPALVQFLSSGDIEVEIAVLEVLEAIAESRNGKLAEAVGSTVPAIAQMLFSPHTRGQISALKVLEVGARSDTGKLAEAVASTHFRAVEGQIIRSNKMFAIYLKVSYRFEIKVRACGNGDDSG